MSDLCTAAYPFRRNGLSVVEAIVILASTGWGNDAAKPVEV